MKEGVPKKDEEISNNLYKMTTKGDCNSRLKDIQNGRYCKEHVLYSSPYLGFTIAADILFF